MLATDRPPVRYGVSFADTDRNWENIAPRIRVFCDGVLMDEVVEYDCEAGTVLKIKMGDDGQPMLNDKRDEILRETVRGNVTVEWED